ncbi:MULTISPECIES: NAD(P)H-binding protein [Nocardiaceae]|uniref:NAD(P)H-binding protein n=1 Tax=Nocardiaceae TaxID=85025 RepID=UPI00055D2C9E|nr:MULTISPECIES: NAD(P)H-binding protein [Rhodococcus]OZF07195.1 nucleoside-diphosphate sugar epimerase [Rhodococcus sp. 15-1189-1-1a]OZF22720.1 nucleoside-diphosphate sugar epimerase [Rhodococcus sp. 14-2686-1-2]OZF58518.1 nucleoside-diphosphate sugar epimerase [Rhodococcus sp. 14-2470-1b]
MNANSSPDARRVLVTGATGYLGGRLAPRLLDAGFTVRVLARNPDKLQGVPWADDVEIAQGDLGDRDSLKKAFADVDVVYYLVHSMGSGGGDFKKTERESAENVAAVAAEAGVSRIVYLGGLHPQSGELSEHLESRAEVGTILCESEVPTFVLQAGVVIGAGSASFEMIRHLTNRLPVMTTPRWVHNKIQPIAVRDILHYLLGAADADLPESRTYDVGGPDVMEYGEMMNIYADVAGLRKRQMVVLPVLTPRLAGHWIGLVTPIPRGLAMPLIESLQFDAVAHETDIDSVVERPEGGLTPYRDAVRLALRTIDDGESESTWTSTVSAPSDPLPSDPDWAGETVFTDVRSVYLGSGADEIRSRLHKAVATGSAENWQIERSESDGSESDGSESDGSDSAGDIRLRSTAKLPGNAWMQYSVVSAGGGTRLEQRIDFFPRGLAGRAFWYGSLPARKVVAGRQLQRVVAEVDRA